MDNKDKTKNNWSHLIILFMAILLTPIFFIILAGLMSNDFRLPLKDFVSSWISLWTAVAIICGIYNIKVAIDKKNSDEMHNKSTLDGKLMQLELDGYYKYIEFLMSDNDAIRINAIVNLHILAKQNPKQYRNKVCNLFCELVKSYSYTLTEADIFSKMPRYITLILKILFASGNNVFEECNKNLNNCIFHNVLLNSAWVKNASFNNAKFKKCNFHDTNIVDSEFIKAKFEDCVIRTCDIKNSNLNRSNFSNVFFDKGHLYNMQFTHAKISKSNFRLSNFTKDSFDGGTIENTNFHGCEFNNGCILNECSLKNLELTFQDDIKLHNFMRLLSDDQLSVTNSAFPIVTININTNSDLDV